MNRINQIFYRKQIYKKLQKLSHIELLRLSKLAADRSIAAITLAKSFQYRNFYHAIVNELKSRGISRVF